MSIEQQISDMLWEGNPICPEYKSPAEKFFDTFALATAENEGMIAPQENVKVNLSNGVEHKIASPNPVETSDIPVLA